jgi:hypothetical protein
VPRTGLHQAKISSRQAPATGQFPKRAFVCPLASQAGRQISPVPPSNSSFYRLDLLDLHPSSFARLASLHLHLQPSAKYSLLIRVILIAYTLHQQAIVFATLILFPSLLPSCTYQTGCPAHRSDIRPTFTCNFPRSLPSQVSLSESSILFAHSLQPLPHLILTNTLHLAHTVRHLSTYLNHVCRGHQGRRDHPGRQV